MRHFVIAILILAFGCNKKVIIPKVDNLKNHALTTKPEVEPVDRIPLMLVVEKEIPKEIKGVFYFGFGKHILSDSEARRIEEFLEGATVIKITGHTCPIGTEEYNYELGFKRANSIGEYVTVKSHGENELITTKPTEYGLNRRVEVYANKKSD